MGDRGNPSSRTIAYNIICGKNYSSKLKID